MSHLIHIQEAHHHRKTTENDDKGWAIISPAATRHAGSDSVAQEAATVAVVCAESNLLDGASPRLGKNPKQKKSIQKNTLPDLNDDEEPKAKSMYMDTKNPKQPSLEKKVVAASTKTEKTQSKSKKKKETKKQSKQDDTKHGKKKSTDPELSGGTIETIPSSPDERKRHRQMQNLEYICSCDESEDNSSNSIVVGISERPGAFAVGDTTAFRRRRNNTSSDTSRPPSLLSTSDNHSANDSIQARTMASLTGVEAATSENIVEAEIAPDVNGVVRLALSEERQRQEELERQRQQQVVTATAVENEANAKLKLLLKAIGIIVLVLFGIVLAVTLSVVLPIEPDPKSIDDNKEGFITTSPPAPETDSNSMDSTTVGATDPPTLETDPEVVRIWQRLGEPMEPPEDPGGGFGTLISLAAPGGVSINTSRLRIAVSSPGDPFGGVGDDDDDDDSPPGSVVVYDLTGDNGELTQMGEIVFGDEPGSSARGVLSGDGTRLVVAEPYFICDPSNHDNKVGHVRVFELDMSLRRQN